MTAKPLASFLAALAGIASCAGSSTPSPGRDAGSAYREAQEADQAGRHDEAVERSTAAIAAAPEAPGPYLIRAKALQAKGRNDEAEADFGRALAKASDHNRAIYHFWRGLFHSDLGRHDRALGDFDRACELQATRPIRDYFVECYLERARTYLALGRPADAIRDCDFILARNPDEATRAKFENIKAQARRK